MEVTRCESLVLEAVNSNPLVKTLISALNRAGCEFSTVRHIACEPLPPGMLGGFDKDLNQVVICSNKCQDLNKVTQILSHELVHMFDDCSTKIDWTDLRHLACSEVRAANLAHCLGPLSGFMRDGAPLLDGHAACVKAKASRSVQLVGKVSRGQAESVVEQVFDKCYLDLEPIGRRCWDGQEQLRAAEEENWRKGKYY